MKTPGDGKIKYSRRSFLFFDPPPTQRHENSKVLNWKPLAGYEPWFGWDWHSYDAILAFETKTQHLRLLRPMYGYKQIGHMKADVCEYDFLGYNPTMMVCDGELATALWSWHEMGVPDLKAWKQCYAAIAEPNKTKKIMTNKSMQLKKLFWQVLVASIKDKKTSGVDDEVCQMLWQFFADSSDTYDMAFYDNHKQSITCYTCNSELLAAGIRSINQSRVDEFWDYYYQHFKLYGKPLLTNIKMLPLPTAKLKQYPPNALEDISRRFSSWFMLPAENSFFRKWRKLGLPVNDSLDREE